MQNFPLPSFCSIMISAIHQFKQNKWVLIYFVQQKSRLIFIEIFNFSIEVRVTNPDSDRHFYWCRLLLRWHSPWIKSGYASRDERLLSLMHPRWFQFGHIAYLCNLSEAGNCPLLSATGLCWLVGASAQHPARLSLLGSRTVQNSAENKKTHENNSILCFSISGLLCWF